MVVITLSFLTRLIINWAVQSFFLQQKLRGVQEFHDNVPVFYKMYDQDLNEESGMVEISGKYAAIEVPSSFEPVYIEMNPNNELAQARTSEFRSITETGLSRVGLYALAGNY